MLLCKGKFHVYEDSGMNDRSDLPPVARLLTEAPDRHIGVRGGMSWTGQDAIAACDGLGG